MAEENPLAVLEQVRIPRPVTGHRRMVQAVHPMCGPGNLLTTDASWSNSAQPNYVNYAFTPPSGPKQRALHSRGSKEITWNLGGELTNNTIGLLKLMDSNARGVQFRSILIYQGTNDSYLFDNPATPPNTANSPTGFSLPWSNFSLSGSQNGSVTFQLEGRSTYFPASPATGQDLAFPDVPVPAWYTGNEFVTAWSLAHSVNLTPVWVNTPDPLPAYYRPSHSEFTIQVTTKVALREHSWIKFGVGGVSMIEAIVTSRNITLGGRNEPTTYQVSTTNAKVSVAQDGSQNGVPNYVQNTFLPSIDITILNQTQPVAAAEIF